ncbi:cupin domain-containing protein [Kibdelosporangium lantanae]|uniref:Cupin domain-containing protein n=1 Tax=Kibdelosporangium lantanae TaxID=1497396 RepID=A0ABW3M592_9PSEU
MALTTIADAASYDVDGYTFRPLAVPSRGTKELAIWHLEAHPGASSTPHHHDREVIFVVKTGAMAGTVGDQDVHAGPGDAIIVPGETMFSLRNASTTEPATLTVVATVGMQAILDGNVITPPWTV